MKKIITIIVTSLLMVTFSPLSLDINAKEISDNLTMIQMLEETSTSFSDYKIEEDNDDLVKISMIYEDGEVYYTFVESDRVYVTDSKDNEVASIDYVDSDVSPVDLNHVPDNIGTLASKWNSYYFAGSRTTEVSVAEGIAIDLAVEVVLHLLKISFSSWIGIGIIVATNIALAIVNARPGNVLISRYVSEWKGCPQYIKEYFQFHSLSMTRWFGTEYRNPRFTSPIDYTSPAACRQINN